VDKGLNMLLFLQRWAGHRGIQLEMFNPCPSSGRELEHAISPYELEFVSLGEVMAVLATVRRWLPDSSPGIPIASGKSQATCAYSMSEDRHPTAVQFLHGPSACFVGLRVASKP
jgi:hypothetical protein